MGLAKGIRVAPPSLEPNNQDVFIWALYILGGSDRDIDVEDVYLRSFDLAPARLGWRTRPDIPDYKKTAKALQSIEASTHVGLVHRTSAYTRRLTAEGVRWVEQYVDILERNYAGGTVVRAAATNSHERRRKAIRASAQFRSWKRGEALDIVELSDAFECNAGSPASVWRSRIEEARRVCDVTQDTELAEFVECADELLAVKIGGYR
jgi:hypothetical protein